MNKSDLCHLARDSGMYPHPQTVRGFPRWLCGLSFLCLCLNGLAQGTMTYNFDGPPAVPDGAAIGVRSYYENGMEFVPTTNSVNFGRIGANPRPERPDNGTAYLQAAMTQSLMVIPIDGSLFNLLSIDLAEYSTVLPNAVTVTFVGYQRAGGVVVTNLTTDGIIDGTGSTADFQTFHFGPEFANLTRVEIPTSGWSLDNIKVSLNVPEPGVSEFGVLGFALWWALRLSPRRTTPTPNHCQ